MRAQQVVPPGSWAEAEEVGAVALDFDQRHRRRIVLSTAEGKELLIDLPDAVRIRGGDGLLLDGGGVVRVVAQPELLLEIRADDAHLLVRIAWHLGNRHLPVQVVDETIRIRADHVIGEMVIGLGGRVEELEAAFDPEAGAYAGGHAHAHEA